MRLLVTIFPTAAAIVLASTAYAHAGVGLIGNFIIGSLLAAGAPGQAILAVFPAVSAAAIGRVLFGRRP